MRSDEIRQWADELRELPLPSILEHWGARQDRCDPCKWHTRRGVLSVNGTKFINWNGVAAGGGAIDLLMHLEQCGFREALEWLGAHYSMAKPTGIEAVSEAKEFALTSSESLALPTPDLSQIRRVKSYLHRRRGIDLALIDALIDSGALYADRRANAVFVLRANGEESCVGAELRGTGPVQWRGMAPGSRKNRGYFCTPSEGTGEDRRPIIVCESAIDAMSCSLIHPGHRCLSSSGARANPRWLDTLLESGRSLYCGYDADDVGEKMAQAMMAMHPTVKRLRPGKHDWNEVLRFRHTA
ncbi:MAG: DUF3991 domain-containing protein [Anaerolineales bacterium]